MVRAPFSDEPAPEVGDVLHALDDRQCREILGELEEPLPASTVAERCDLPLSTAYRKLDILSAGQLVRERTAIRRDGRHATQYRCDVEAVTLSLDDNRRFEVEIERPSRAPEQRLAELWTEVRREA